MIKVAAAGDFQPTTYGVQVASLVQQEGVARMIGLGDMAYKPYNFNDTKALYGSIPFSVVPGSHDVEHGGLSAFMKFWGIARTYYKLMTEEVELIVLNNQTYETAGIHKESIQEAWYKQQIKRADRWRIVAFHDPLWVSADYNCRPFREWDFSQADLVLSASFHHYESTDMKGVRHVCVGTGGKTPLYDGWKIPRSQMVYRAKVYGALFIEIEPKHLAYYFKDTDGRIHDEWEKVK